eukprot:scaffold8291_cov64-Phaeocystis_antarctica.AAC.5
MKTAAAADLAEAVAAAHAAVEAEADACRRLSIGGQVSHLYIYVYTPPPPLRRSRATRHGESRGERPVRSKGGDFTLMSELWAAERCRSLSVVSTQRGLSSQARRVALLNRWPWPLERWVAVRGCEQGRFGHDRWILAALSLLSCHGGYRVAAHRAETQSSMDCGR